MTPDLLEAWLAWRRTGITATDTAGILGLSPWSTPYSIWADKAGLLPAAEVTDAMEFGTRAEDMLALWFRDRTGLFVLGEQTWCTGQEHPWMLATVDGFAHGNPAAPIADALGGVEFKTTTDTAAEWDEQIPNHIMCQVQWQMAVTGMPVTYLATLHLGFRVEFRVREVARDDADIAALREACGQFWRDHCLTGTPPETDGSDATTRALKAAWPGDDTLDAIEADAELRIECARINAIKARIKESEASLAEAENNLRGRMGDHTALTNGVDDKGRPLVLATWKPGTRTTIDTAAFKADYPGLIPTYTKTTTTRTLLVKNPKEK